MLLCVEVVSIYVVLLESLLCLYIIFLRATQYLFGFSIISDHVTHTLGRSALEIVRSCVLYHYKFRAHPALFLNYTISHNVRRWCVMFVYSIALRSIFSDSSLIGESEMICKTDTFFSRPLAIIYL